MAAGGGGAGELPCGRYRRLVLRYLKDQIAVIIIGPFEFCHALILKQHLLNRFPYCRMIPGQINGPTLTDHSVNSSFIMIKGSYWIIGKFNVRGALLSGFNARPHRLVIRPLFDQWNELIREQCVRPT